MTDELLKALKTIKQECLKHSPKEKIFTNCESCPLLTATEECGVMWDEPRNWTLEKREVYF